MISRRIKKLWEIYKEKEKTFVVPREGFEVSYLLVFPNVYSIGISNLGFQTVFARCNSMPGVSCDLLFFPDEPFSIDCERGFELPSYYLERTPLEFDAILFSISFENDLTNVVKLLRWMKIPVLSEERREEHPLLVCGGIVPSTNPEPFAEIFDVIILGDAEGALEVLTDAMKNCGDKDELFHYLKDKRGFYIPALYPVDRSGAFWIPEVSDVEKNVWWDFMKEGNASVIVTPDSVFSDMFIIEVSRGCPKRCFFCLSSWSQIPVRFVKTSVIRKKVRECSFKKIGLLGTSVSEHRGLVKILGEFSDITFSFSSIRIDSHPLFIEAVKRSGARTVTFGIEAASERLRRRIGKYFPDELIFERLEEISESFEIVKLYFMVGLPKETEEDIEAFEPFFRRLSQILKNNIISVSISSFVPKPFTPFEREAFEDVKVLKSKIKKIKSMLSPYKNVKVNFELPKWAKVQALISRGDRRVGLYYAGKLKKIEVEKYLSSIPPEVKLPWDFIKIPCVVGTGKP